MVFPELGISAYSNEDLFQQDALLDGSVQALDTLIEASKEIAITFAVGMPLRVDDRLFNCAVLLRRGELLGAVPKTYLPNYREFYEKRHFASGADCRDAVLHRPQWPGADEDGDVPFGPDLLFEVSDVPGLTLHVEVCEDMWVPIPPSAEAALAGATVLANLSGSPITVAPAISCISLTEIEAECRAGTTRTLAGPVRRQKG